MTDIENDWFHQLCARCPESVTTTYTDLDELIDHAGAVHKDNKVRTMNLQDPGNLGMPELKTSKSKL